MSVMLDPTPSAQSQLDEAIARLRDKFVAEMPERLDRLDGLMWNIEHGVEPLKAAMAVRDESHKLAGISKPLGFTEVGELAFNVECTLNEALKAEGRPLPQQAIGAIDQLLDALDKVVVTSTAAAG